MIDPHCHLRDWNQSHKETLEHGFDIAYRAGLDGVFEMPNTDPALTSEETLIKRIEDADAAIGNLPLFHGIYAGITADEKQIEEVVNAWNIYFPRVIGLKMFAGQSTGNMGLVDDTESSGEQKQMLVYKTLAELGYKGVLAVHCEKENLMKKEVWNPEQPYTHCEARPPQAEVESILNQIEFAEKAGYKGTLHICHISDQSSISKVARAKERVDFQITSGVTPHHCMLYDSMMDGENGLYLKMNPPLRTQKSMISMMMGLKGGVIDWIETDHAPHTKDDKLNRYSSGIPGFAFYPHFIKKLRENCTSETRINQITHDKICDIFNFGIPNSHRDPDYDLFKEYEFNAFEKVL
ncbi:dihydroorotase [Candidatus Woesearchaeota archaeon]|nr:dihydroorotase [Candidatus Woesearchaeota archaeon]